MRYPASEKLEIIKCVPAWKKDPVSGVIGA